MSVKSAVFILILSACCMCLLAAPALAIYTTSDLGGSLVRGHQFTVDITGKPKHGILHLADRHLAAVG